MHNSQNTHSDPPNDVIERTQYSINDLRLPRVRHCGRRRRPNRSNSPASSRAKRCSIDRAAWLKPARPVNRLGSDHLNPEAG